MFHLTPTLKLVILPYVIQGPGDYVTRCGERVSITSVDSGTHYSPRDSYSSCRGTYSCGTVESWHPSGRLYTSRECQNDIVRKA